MNRTALTVLFAAITLTSLPAIAAPAPPTPEQRRLLDELRRRAHESRALVRVAELADKPVREDRAPSDSPESFKRLITEAETLTGLAQDCEGKYAGLPTYDAKSLYEPARVCGLAKGWKEVVGKHLTHAASYRARTTITNLKAAVAKLDSDGIFYESDQKAMRDLGAKLAADRQAWQPLFTQVGLEAAERADADGDAALASAWSAALKRAGTVNRFPKASSFHDKATESALSAAVAAAGFQVLKTGLVADAPDVERSGSIVRSTKRSGHVLARAKDEPFCRIYLVTATSELVGATLTKPKAFFDRPQLEATISSCR